MHSSVSVLLLVAFLYQAALSEGTSYNYINGGLDWPSPTNSCGGNSQSPIALDPTKAVTNNDFYFNFELNDRQVNTTIVSTPHISLKGEFSSLKFRDINGVLLEYSGVGMHFHSPGEHFVNGRLYDTELHFVHYIKSEYEKSTAYKYAVVGVLFEAKEKESSKFIKSLNLSKQNPDRSVNLQKILGDDLKQLRTLMHYQGSFTSPTCDETVNWFVFTTPLKMSIAQQAQMDLNFRSNRSFAQGRGNNRLVQKLNGRTVTLFKRSKKSTRPYLVQGGSSC